MGNVGIVDSYVEGFGVKTLIPDGKLLAGITSDSDNHNTRIQVLQRP